MKVLHVDASILGEIIRAEGLNVSAEHRQAAIAAATAAAARLAA